MEPELDDPKMFDDLWAIELQFETTRPLNHQKL
jgi:hypothetical protein